MERKHLMTIGEFAALCGTTRHTLYHYHNTGLLSPVQIENNKYRLYAPEQYIPFMNIQNLQETGMSLADISAFLRTHQVSDTIPTIQTCIAELERKQRELENSKQALASIINMIEYAHRSRIETLNDERCEEDEYALAVPILDADANDMDVSAFSRMFQLAGEYRIIGRLLSGAVIDQTSLKERFYFLPLQPEELERIPAEYIYHKPAGRFMSMTFHEDESITADEYNRVCCARLLDAVHLAGCTPVGDIYMYNLISHLATNVVDEFVFEFMVRVE